MVSDDLKQKDKCEAEQDNVHIERKSSGEVRTGGSFDSSNPHMVLSMLVKTLEYRAKRIRTMRQIDKVCKTCRNRLWPLLR